MGNVTANAAIKTDSDHLELLRRLLAARGIERYGLYLLASEHTIAPSGFEEMSGYVVRPDGYAHFFWTGWDAERQADTFTVWRDVEAQAQWADDDEFREALAEARATEPSPSNVDQTRVG